MTNKEYMIEHFDDLVRCVVKMTDEETCCCAEWLISAGLLTLPDHLYPCNENCVECINKILKQNHE